MLTSSVVLFFLCLCIFICISFSWLQATRALKGALEALKGAAEEANTQELTPDGRAALDDAQRRLNDILRKLLEATKRRLDNPNDPEAHAAFLKALEDGA